MTNFDIFTSDPLQNKKIVALCNNQLSLFTVFEVLSMNWISNETLSFNDVHCCETVAFDLQNGAVTGSLNCGAKHYARCPLFHRKHLVRTIRGC